MLRRKILYKRGGRNNIMFFADQPKMIQAILKGEIHTVKNLVANGEDVNELDNEKRSYLHLAAFVNATEITKILISAGARVDCKDNNWLTPLHRACRNNLDAIVQILIDNDADVNCRDRSWITPLHVCAANNALECARLFITKVPNIDVSDRSGATALHHAAFNGHCDVITFLLKHNASVTAFDKKERRPIHYAALADNTDAIRLLHSNGSEIDVFDKEMLTPLHIAAAKGCLNALQMLIELGAKVNAIDIQGYTPLHWACLHGQDDVIDELIAHGASLGVSNHIGITPLHLAAASISGSPALEVLIRHLKCLDIDARDKYGRTPLHLASKYGRLNQALDLKRCGANIDATDKCMLTPFHYAARRGHSPLLNNLLGNEFKASSYLDNSGMTPLHYGAYYGYTDICCLLLNYYKPEEILASDTSGRTVHFLAAYSGNFDCLCLFLPLPKFLDSFNRSILHYAATTANIECVNLLLSTAEQSFAINQQDIYGRVPLHYCAMVDDQGSATNALIKNGAKIDLPDNEGYYCVHYAAAAGNLQSLELLLSDNFQTQIWCKREFRPCLALCASVYGRSECLRFLLRKNIIRDATKCLEFICLNGYIDCLQVLVEETNILNSLNFGNALHYAALKGHHNCLDILTVKLRTVDMRDEHLRTPLMFAALNAQNNYETILYLLRRESDINALDINDRSVLFYCCFSGSEDMVQLFIENNAYLLAYDVQCKTVFHIAAALGYSDVLNALLNALNEINSSSVNNNNNSNKQSSTSTCSNNKISPTDLTDAITAQARETANTRLFCDLLFDRNGFTPLHWACLRSHVNCVNVLLENLKVQAFFGSSITPFHIAAYKGNREIMQLLLSYFGKEIVHATDKKDRNALHYLCLSKVENKACLNILLDNHINVNIIDRNKRTPIMYAIENDLRKIATTILHTGYDLLLEDNYGNNCLHYSCIYKCETIGLQIIELDASLVKTTNCQLKTPLHIAAENGLIKLCEKLLLSGASVNESDIDNYTPSLCCAKNANVAECLMLIESIMIYDAITQKARESDLKMTNSNNYDDSQQQQQQQRIENGTIGINETSFIRNSFIKQMSLMNIKSRKSNDFLQTSPTNIDLNNTGASTAAANADLEVNKKERTSTAVNGNAMYSEQNLEVKLNEKEDNHSSDSDYY